MSNFDRPAQANASLHQGPLLREAQPCGSKIMVELGCASWPFGKRSQSLKRGAAYSTSAGSTVSRSPIAPRIERMVSNDGFPSSPNAL